jgi:putative endopeptidase
MKKTLSPPCLLCLCGFVCASLLAAQPPRPQDDLFAHVNHEWLSATPIPDDRVTYSAAAELVDRVEHQLHALIEDLVREGNHRRGSEAQQIVDLYRSVTDSALVEQAGMGPVAEDLGRINTISGVDAASALAGQLSVTGEGGPFDVTLVAAGRRAGRTVARVAAGGLLLPDSSYYLSASPEIREMRRAYAAYLVRLFVAAGQAHEQAESDAGRVIAFETAMAQALRSSGGGVPSPRVWSLSEIERELPGFGWRQWAKPQGLDRAAGLLLDHPEFFRAFSASFGRTPPATLSAWLRARFLTAMAPYLPAAVSRARFDFFGTTLTGQVAPRPPWKRGVSMVSEFLGDAIGRRYVARHFPSEARDRARNIVNQLLETARDGIGRAEWLPADRRDAARQRLSTIEAQIGYPDEWRSYAGLTIRPDELLGNLRRLRTFDTRYRMQRAQVARTSRQWLMSAQTVNAYYSPAQHEFALPAGILQPPYFDVQVDEAANYGAIGAVVGHEVSHALDLRSLAPQASGLRAQFAAYEVQPGILVNADLTFAESLADVAGLQLAYRAYRRSLGDRPPEVINGLTGDQRFFFGWVRIWRGHSRPDYLRYTNETSPHAPPQFRANGAVSHLDAFYDAFGVAPGDRLYRPADGRLRVW